MNEELKKIITIIMSILSIGLGVITLSMEWGLKWYITWPLAICFIALANVMLIAYFRQYQKTYKFCITIWVALVLVALFYAICYFNNWLQYFDSTEKIKELITSAGIWGILVFFLIQFMQVICAPIPAMATTLVGVALYGPLVASLVSIIAVLLGSFFAFFLGRKFGRKVVVWIAGEEQTKKYCDILNKKGRILLVLMFLFPVFPDDLLCLVAGITSMSFRFFFFASVFTRPIGILATAYFGSGELIPYSGWGLYVWPFIIILLIVVFVMSWKYQDRFEKYFIDKFDAFKEKKLQNKNKNKK